MMWNKILLRNGSWHRLLNLNKENSTRGMKFKFFNRSKEQEETSDDEAETTVVEHSTPVEMDTEIIDQKRNKSGLQEHHYLRHQKKFSPISEDSLEVLPIWRYRKLYGRYGAASKVDTKALWPSTYEMKVMKEREKVEFPHTLQEMIQIAKDQKEEDHRIIWERQEEIKKNLKSLHKYKENIYMRMKKKEEDSKTALDLRQKQIEEVRQILGYKIGAHDPKFKEIMDKKLEEDRIKAKKEKKLRKAKMMLDRLNESVKEASEQAEQEDPLYGKKIE